MTGREKKDALSDATKGINKQEGSIKDDHMHKAATHRIVEDLKTSYPNHNFKVITRLKNECIGKLIDRDLEYSNLWIQPDGGIIIMDDTFIIYASEAKRQGQFNSDGSIKRACGNAVERFAKNLNVIDTIFENEEILPYLVACHGAAFSNPSINNQLYSGNHFKRLNVLYNYRQGIGMGKGASIFTQLQTFTENDVYDLGIKLAKMAVEYFNEKYYDDNTITCNYVNTFVNK